MPPCRRISVSKNDHYLRKEPFCSLVYFSFCLNGSFAEGRDDLEGERPKQELTEISIRRWNRCHWFKNSPIRFFADFYPFSKVVFFFKSQGNALRPLPSVRKKFCFAFLVLGHPRPFSDHGMKNMIQMGVITQTSVFLWLSVLINQA